MSSYLLDTTLGFVAWALMPAAARLISLPGGPGMKAPPHWLRLRCSVGQAIALRGLPRAKMAQPAFCADVSNLIHYVHLENPTPGEDAVFVAHALMRAASRPTSTLKPSSARGLSHRPVVSKQATEPRATASGPSAIFAVESRRWSFGTPCEELVFHAFLKQTQRTPPRQELLVA